MEIKPVAHIYTDFPTKFGIPRQSGLIEGLKGRIVFEPYYHDPEAVKGLEGFNYLWLLWDFSEAHRKDWSATAKPPRLGGKTHMGVWATRSPYRPNSIGLSSVHLDAIEYTENGPELIVSGIDMMNGTPIYDIKPYTRFDIHEDVTDGYIEHTSRHSLEVDDPEGLVRELELTEEKKTALYEVLSQDPRPQYDANDDGKRVYGFYYCNYDVRFTVNGKKLIVKEIEKTD